MLVTKTLELTIVIREEDLSDIMVVMASGIRIISEYMTYNEILKSDAVNLHIGGYKSDILNLADWLEKEYAGTAIICE